MVAAKGLREKGIEHVLVSMGKKGLLSVSEEGELWAKSPAIKSVNTVGCGDSVVASYAMSLLKEEDEYTALRRVREEYQQEMQQRWKVAIFHWSWQRNC